MKAWMPFVELFAGSVLVALLFFDAGHEPAGSLIVVTQVDQPLLSVPSPGIGRRIFLYDAVLPEDGRRMDVPQNLPAFAPASPMASRAARP